MRKDEQPPYSSPVKAWTDPGAWAERLTPEGCPFCPMEPWSDYVELPASWVLIPEKAVLPGYVLVVSKRHVIEPYELPPDESAQFWADAMRAAAAVASVVQPVKVNYEIHGNTIPHLHLHVFPRFRGDPFERSPIDPHAVKPRLRPAGEIEALRGAIADGREPTPMHPIAPDATSDLLVPGRIRALVIGVAVNDDRIFVIEGHDRIKNETFYRPPGGGIDFGESSEAALRREFGEELSFEPARAEYIGTLENVFTFDGQPAHEVVAVYRVELPPEDRLRLERVTGHESDGMPFEALWLPLDAVRSGSAILYPDGLLELLEVAS